jgi:formylglycine-generating enzyme required for sulfatase activity
LIVLLLIVVLPAGCSSSEEALDEQVVAEPESSEPRIGEMVLIPAGEFTMGSAKNKYAAPERKVNLPAYYIDAYEVTFGQWIQFVQDSGFEPESDWRSYYSIGKEDFPVANITLDDALKYAEWAGKRLPTEAEWEKAARGAEGFLYPWGNQWDPTKSNCGEYGMRNTVKAGQMYMDKSPYGVRDLMGNVQEWTSDKYRPYPGGPAANEEVFKRGYQVVRGASFVYFPSKGEGMYLYTRSGAFPKAQFGLGFRCAKDAEGDAPKQTEKLELKLLALLLPALPPELESR